MHLHPTIHQDLSAKPARLYKVTSRCFALPQVEFNIDVLRVRLCRIRQAILLICGFFWWLSGRAGVYSFHSTTTDPERRWSTSSFLSICLSISARLLIETCKTFLIASVDYFKKVYPSWCKNKKRVVAVATCQERKTEVEICKIWANEWRGLIGHVILGFVTLAL